MQTGIPQVTPDNNHSPPCLGICVGQMSCNHRFSFSGNGRGHHNHRGLLLFKNIIQFLPDQLHRFRLNKILFSNLYLSIPDLREGSQQRQTNHSFEILNTPHFRIQHIHSQNNPHGYTHAQHTPQQQNQRFLRAYRSLSRIGIFDNLRCRHINQFRNFRLFPLLHQKKKQILLQLLLAGYCPVLFLLRGYRSQSFVHRKTFPFQPFDLYNQSLFHVSDGLPDTTLHPSQLHIQPRHDRVILPGTQQQFLAS